MLLVLRMLYFHKFGLMLIKVLVSLHKERLRAVKIVFRRQLSVLPKHLDSFVTQITAPYGQFKLAFNSLVYDVLALGESGTKDFVCILGCVDQILDVQGD